MIDQKPATAVSNTTCAADDHKCIAASDGETLFRRVFNCPMDFYRAHSLFFLTPSFVTDYLVGDDSNKTRGNVRPPKGLTSPINLPQTQVRIGKSAVKMMN